MTRLALFGLSALGAVAACGANASSPPIGSNTAGSGGSAPVAGSASSGGTTSVAGAAPSGGSVATGGTPGGGTGGSVATGGSFPAAGSAGAGGTSAVVQKDCANKAALTSPVFATFEGYDGSVDATLYAYTLLGAPTVYAGSYFYDDDANAAAEFGTSTFAILAGHASNWGLSLVRTYPGTTVDATAWGAALGLWHGCVDASAYQGISFWVRGAVPRGVISFILATEDTSLPNAANPAGGGTCVGATSATCVPPRADDIPVTADWTQISLPWAMLVPGINGAASVIPNGNNLTGMQFSVGLEFIPDPAWVDNPDDPLDMPLYFPVPGNIDLKIDDVAFIQ